MIINSDLVNEVCMWNEERDNLHYNNSLEYSMLDEEVEEYYAASMVQSEVGQADALADIAVVAIGGLFKLCGGDLQKVHDILIAVTAANNSKSSTKNSEGKITKPKDFVGPEVMISKILGKYNDC